MAVGTYLVGSGLMLALLVVVALGINRRRDHVAGDLLGDVMGVEPEEDALSGLFSIVTGPAGWFVAFLALILGGVGAVALVLDGADLTLVGAILAFGLVGYLALGSYSMARNRGNSSAMSFFVSTVILGLLAIAAAMGHLIFIT